MKAKRYSLLIGGKEITTKHTFPTINPAKPKDILGYFPKATKKDVDTAVRAAREAFPVWSQYPAPRRGEFLLRIATILRERKEQLAQLVTREMGKNIIESKADIQEAIDIAEYMA